MPGVEHVPAIRGLRPRTLVDLGANKGQFSLVARRLFPEILIHAFEPIATERAKLSSVLKGEQISIYPVAVGRQAETREFFVTSRLDSSSLLKPTLVAKETFDILPVSVNSIAVVRLADVIRLAELPRPVLLKIDVQGGELDVFKSARRLLRSAVIVQTEISFVPLYRNQPPFGTIDTFLRDMGFLPHCFAEMKLRTLSPMVVDGDTGKGLRQLVEADIVYVRDVTKPENMNPEQWKHLALVAHHCYDSVDLALRAIVAATGLGALKPGTADRYLQHLASLPIPATAAQAAL